MDPLLKLREKPTARDICMIAGWDQWADAGDISSGLPQYLIDLTHARKIGEIEPAGFYIFQVPGTHHFLRPEVKFVQGHRVSMKRRRNEFFYTGDERHGLVIFLGEEPHLAVERYSEAFLTGIKELSVREAIIVGGVYAETPYDRDREVSCTYSLPSMKEELAPLAVRFSDYEGGATIGSYMVDRAEALQIAIATLNAFVPAYDFSSAGGPAQGLRIETDTKAWFDLMSRINHLFALGIDLSELQSQAERLTFSIGAELRDLADKQPELKVLERLARLALTFEETHFMPLEDMWEEELGDIFRGIEGV